ncbi:probable methyltransferase BMT2 homolog [Pseudomyrmex gracilis]|uniref:probable methyltransferase BMT2 homolog n=1 Tax=Pseudomyrmex gracilis TaxID=219809 RepID=UPI0009952412|nr:probable methyltransferase BMT2 homolog [Pseudomyrmex gracilis]
MATEEHKRLADVVKRTHSLLRVECHRYGAKIAWDRHVARNDVLQEYAESMQKLATKYWTENNSKNGTYCRMEWIKLQCKEYFLNGGEEKFYNREQDIKRKMTLEKSSIAEDQQFENNQILMENKSQNFHNQRISILDVGSCYNPLNVDDTFNVTAIDLIPAVEGVFQCDFLNVDIGRENIFSSDMKKIYQLQTDTFDAVIFSLLLEYLPCPKQRYVCCKNAYNVLKSGGILIIVSPDSNHIGANAKLMKSWRYTLSKLGFMRIKYEKLRHIHCLVFRKCVCKDVGVRWADLQQFSENDKRYISEIEIFIPQDFQTISFKEKQEKINYVETEVANTFSELPFDNETS